METDGRHLIVFTDHMPILGAFKAPNTQPYDPIAQQHIQEISNFTNDIRYVEGKSNAVADWLSRPPDVPIGAAYDLPAMATMEGLALAAGSVPAVAATNELSNQLNALAMEMLDHKTLARDQKECPDVANHRSGKLPKLVTMADVEFSPKVTLFCEVSQPKARPLVPKHWRDRIIRLYHQLTHAGQKDTIKKMASN